ncbi:flagellar basal body rod C-terminal domain-containing protein [Hydrogenimonas thermophila]|uniref:flagellar basal body rod C-terminal domain-containing protein n=1 Tax=Hydrogenimonas thermophila TaxID=223786 RepID=UPI002936ECCD|nr:flagellar basal body rod C-terminal domain-containing protein [Hydrogenimonas thermophila]WOE72376.1 flagellar basal body rod C-terminal domain-containing protein [Hydrogenimonas thermophila]
MQVNVNSMLAYQSWMNQSANNVANINTELFDANRTVIEEGPVPVSESTGKPTDLAKEMTDQIVVADGFEAQASVIKTYDEMLGTLLDMKG